MSDVKWIQLKVNMFEDEKIRLIESMPDGDTLLVLWFKLLSQAGRTNAKGYIFLNENIPYTPEMLSTIFNRPLQTVRLALQTFKQFGMIDIDDSDFIFINNWEKHQNVDGLEKLKLSNAERQKRYRERKKLEQQGIEAPSEDSENNVESNVTRNVTDNATSLTNNALDIDKELDKEIDKDIKKKDTKKKKTVSKIKYAEFVSMTEEEYKKLLENYGEANVKRMIETLDNYKGANGKKYKSDYRAILTWVVERVTGSKQPAVNFNKQNNGGNEFETDAERYKGIF